MNDQVTQIEERNRRVEADKAWETSWTRRLLIALLTYIVIVVFFTLAELPNPWVNAIVPTIGFVLSTLSLSLAKRVWLKYVYKRK